MHTLVKTNNLATEEWLAYRRFGIGGSDASVVMGVNPYRSILSLWEDKTGAVPVHESENTYTHFGKVLEPVVKGEFMNRTGLTVRARNAILQSDNYPWMLANLDGVVTENGEHVVFEAKTASEYKKEVWKSGVPPEYYAQLQHYLAVTGWNKAYIAAIVGGNSYFCHEVYRDDEYIAELIRKEAEFWESVRYKRRPKVDGSEATTTFLNEVYAESICESVELPADARNMVDEYKRIDQEVKQLNSKKTEISNNLKDMLQNKEVGMLNGDAIVTWKKVVRTSLDTEKLKGRLASELNDYMTESSYRRFSVA